MDITSSAMSGLTGSQWKSDMLKGGAGEAEQAAELAKEFEGILMRQFLDVALKPMDPESGLFGGKASPMYDQMIKDTLSSSLTSHSSLGFASVLQSQLFPNSLNNFEGKESHE